MGQTREVIWLGGIQDGAHVLVPYDTTWVNVLEDRRAPKGGPTQERSLVRYTVPIIDDKIIWAQRVQADLEDD
jgi:hypothetical protein